MFEFTNVNRKTVPELWSCNIEGPFAIVIKPGQLNAVSYEFEN